ncbi:carbohydrate ABC transporter permease [Lachnospiraceae bacterium OttesenSCG-928-D06]|nr:carbohydrate ABC transporter permease [Lachnospiraceae bacterium OttesenSCG-928-D06]
MKKKNIKSDSLIIGVFYVLLGVFSLICLIPLILAVSGSLSTEDLVSLKGFSLLPRGLTLDTYKYVFESQGAKLLSAYAMTITITLLGTAIAVGVTTSFAYVLTVKSFKHRNKLAFFAYFTMLFSGGMLPWYLVCTKYYHLNDNLLGLILPYCMNVFYMYLIRNSIQGLPYELTESAQIDGAGYFQIFVRIILPLSKAGIVTITLFYALTFWNDFYLPLMLVSEEKYFTIQYILYKMNSNIQYLASNPSGMGANHIVLPTQTIKMAITCIAIGPIALIYPFVQKYFVKGVTVGALKG